MKTLIMTNLVLSLIMKALNMHNIAQCFSDGVGVQPHSFTPKSRWPHTIIIVFIMIIIAGVFIMRVFIMRVFIMRVFIMRVFHN